MTDIYNELRYFKSIEFGPHYASMDPAMLRMLDETRHRAGIPFKVNSHFRTEAHNRSVGGARNSAHLRGHAVDIHCPSGAGRMAIVKAALQVGFRRIGIGRTFVHLDNDPDLPQDTIWLY